MIKEAILFTGAFALSSLLGSTGAGCSSDDCDCSWLPDRLPVQSGYRITSLAIEGDAAPTIQSEGGTLESTRATIVIRYGENAVMHEVVYAVEGQGP
jgi:hypothetical protein